MTDAKSHVSTKSNIQESSQEDRWGQDQPQVKALIRYIQAEKKRGRTLEPADLVAWDEDHGGTLFCYEAGDEAVRQRRLELARKFLTRLTAWLDRARGIKGQLYRTLPVDLERGDDGYVSAVKGSPSAIYSLRDIHGHELHRDLVIQKLTAEMKTAAGQLRFWKLSAAERRAIIAAIEEELG